MRTPAMSFVCPERTGIEVQVVRRVIAVDVGVFEKVGLGAENPKMANGVLDYIRVTIAQGVGELVPVAGRVQRADGVRNEHVLRARSEGLVPGGLAARLTARRTSGPLVPP